MRGWLKSMGCMFFLKAFYLHDITNFQRKGFPSCLCQDKRCLRGIVNFLSTENVFKVNTTKFRNILFKVEDPICMNSAHFAKK